MKVNAFLLVYIICVVGCYSESDETESALEPNASCKTPNDKSARCISIYDCRVLYDQLTSSKQSTIDFLRASDCGVHEEIPLVCCGEDADYDAEHQPIEQRNRTVNISTRTGEDTEIHLGSRFGGGDDGRIYGSRSQLAGRHECGYMDQDKILNGIVANMDEFPWMALLQYKRRSDGSKKFLCGGSLIGNRYVLTAAHCVVGEIEKTHRLTGVRLGEYNILEERDCFRYGNYVECTDPPLDVGIERATAHAQFDETRKEKPNDIALLRLDRDISYTVYIRPICLPSIYDTTPVGKHLTVAGWGRTESASASAVKLKLRVPMTTKRYCRQVFRKAGANIRDTQICAGGVQGRDSCTGDSGGPLMTVYNDNSEQWYIEGIVSFGTTCGTKGWPGVYTKVNAYLDWINENL